MTEHETLESTRQRLLAKREELLTREARVTADLRSAIPADFAEQATALENTEVLQGLRTEAREELGKIELALRRLQEGRYGRCMECGGDIAEARLAAYPHAVTCIACESRVNVSGRSALP